MFGKDDGFDVRIAGIKTKTGISRPYCKSITDGIDVSDDILAIEISELHARENRICYYNPFNIYIGEIHTIMELMMNGEKVYTDWREDSKSINPLRDVVCYINDKGQKVVYAYVYDSDIVVKNVEELKKVLEEISNSVTEINKSSLKIKKLCYKNM